VSTPNGAAARPVAPKPVTAALFVTEAAEAWLPTIASLRDGVPDVAIVSGSPSAEVRAELVSAGIECLDVGSAARLVDLVYARTEGHVLLVGAPAMFPPDPLSRARAVIEADVRCATVSFLSNVGDYAGFPVPDAISMHQVEDLDEVSITRLLRAVPAGLGPVPVPYPVGPAVLFNAHGLSFVPRPDADLGPGAALMAAEYGARARARGLLDLLDPATFVTRPLDGPDPYPAAAGLTAEQAAWFAARHPALAAAAHEPGEADAPFRGALALARATVFGLRVLIDGTCLGPKEMGTQVAVLELVAALADHDGVAYVGVALPGPVPPYAAATLGHPKIEARHAPDGDLSAFPEVDVVHRPFQVTPGVDPASWRTRGRRTAVTVFDLIAYQVPDYHHAPSEWFAYRRSTRDAAAEVDGTIVISADTAKHVALEQLAVPPERLFCIPLGVGHLRGDEPAVEPDELVRRGFAGDPFLLVLGANYAHKNRDVAVEVRRELHRRGHGLALVLAGALVPFGSSRTREAGHRADQEPVYSIPDVTSEERNWLLRHADLVLYPTSAEGFGFIPHEAAAFGTPTVMVPFGPFRERLADLPVAPGDWGVGAWADACETLLGDPAVARAQVAAVAAATPEYDWSGTAAATVEVYRSLLAQPARSSL
jgi:glycosyltransferase involved in cell wall biosynthesis